MAQGAHWGPQGAPWGPQGTPWGPQGAPWSPTIVTFAGGCKGTKGLWVQGPKGPRPCSLAWLYCVAMQASPVWPCRSLLCGHAGSPPYMAHGCGHQIYRIWGPVGSDGGPLGPLGGPKGPLGPPKGPLGGPKGPLGPPKGPKGAQGSPPGGISLFPLCLCDTKTPWFGSPNHPKSKNP